MYFPIGWPKTVNLSLPNRFWHIHHICCDAVKILLAAIGDDFLGLWYANPLIPITFFRRSNESLDTIGTNKLIFWKPDSRKLAVFTSAGLLVLYQVDFEISAKGGVLTLVDPPHRNLKRECVELFIKENIPRLKLKEICVISMESKISTLCCIILSELIIATEDCKLTKMRWEDLGRGVSNNAVMDLQNIPFYVNQNSNKKSLPTIGVNRFATLIEYSPFIGGCAIIFDDDRAAFLVTVHLPFQEKSVHGFWVPDVDDATICNVNHKFRLLAYGRRNSDVNVYAIEDTTGGLEFSHKLSINSRLMPGGPGPVNDLKWTPDGCVLAVSWAKGGFSLWSTFGALLTTSLHWDFSIHTDLIHKNPLKINKMEWLAEGYQLYLSCSRRGDTEFQSSNVLVVNFVRSTLTMNPCMTSTSHILLQGDDTLYFNLRDNLESINFGASPFPNVHNLFRESERVDDGDMEINNTFDVSRSLSESKFWNVLQLPLAYAASNWPIRYSAIDVHGFHIAVAGRTGLAHYSIQTKKWKLFGNESQEKEFVASGGLLWWKEFIIMGCYSLLDRIDEIRCYPEQSKLDNEFGKKIQVRAPVISVNIFKDQLIVLTADGCVTTFSLIKHNAFSLSVDSVYELDVKSICIHPACITSLTVINLKNDTTTKSNQVTEFSTVPETIILNVCGRILMIQHELHNNVNNSFMASCLASCVEVFWVSSAYEKSSMLDCLWLFSGAQGMRVWLPILPPTNEEERDASHRLHTFMSKRIMLSFSLKLYPLVIRFENVIIIGVENDTTLYLSEQKSFFSMPFCLLERKSQVYLHKILRQLIKYNLGYSAWEIAKSCSTLPYFPHALELLLHEVLEKEATSKDPIPDALLPSILDFIREFPVYMQTIMQCARKTEIALWPHLFSMAGKPKDLFEQCLQCGELETAASYLIILQNLEPSAVSKQYATNLLDVSLRNRKWELAKDLVRFLKAIDPNEIDSPRSSMVINMKIAPSSQTKAQVNQNPEVFNLILGPIARQRSFSTTTLTNTPKGGKGKNTGVIPSAVTSANSNMVGSDSCTAPISSGVQSISRRRSERNNSFKERRDTFFIESILQRHARMLLQKLKLMDLGYMSAFLDVHLVSWLTQEQERTVELDFVETLKILHRELELSPLLMNHSIEDLVSQPDVDIRSIQRDIAHIQRESSQTSESGYFSVALMNTPLSTNDENRGHNKSIVSENRKILLRCRSNSEESFDKQRCKIFTSRPFSMEFDSAQIGEYVAKLLPDNLAVKIRYLLQLFIEANCMDYALLLSIVLQDAASIGRIINVLIRSGSPSTCRRIESVMLNFANWCITTHCIYHTFAIALQPHLYLLHRYLQPTSNINNFPHYMTRNTATDVPSCSKVVEESINIFQKDVKTVEADWTVEKYDHCQQNTLIELNLGARKKHINIPLNTGVGKESISKDVITSSKRSECNCM